MVAVQGASRSLRHGDDGRASPDGLLWCRWAHQTVRELKGCSPARPCCRRWATAPCPPRCSTSRRRRSCTRRTTGAGWATSPPPAPACTGPSIGVRLDAEAAMRFGADAVYDGDDPGAGRPGGRTHREGRPRRPAAAPLDVRRGRAIAGRHHRVVATVGADMARVGGGADPHRHARGAGCSTPSTSSPTPTSSVARRRPPRHGRPIAARPTGAAPHDGRRGAGLPGRRGRAGEGDRRRGRRARRRREGAGRAGEARSTTSTW